MLIVPVLVVVIRGVFACLIELFPDEAYYWAWSRTISGGYFDHPPLVAWLIRLCTAVFGTHEFTVRLPAILLAGGSVLVASEIARQLSASARTILSVQLLLLAFPMLHVQGLVITPDSPAAFSVLLMLLAGVHCLRPAAPLTWWLLLGVAAGLAMLSKYTALIPVSAAFLCLLVHRPATLPKLILAGLIASATLIPMFLWNAAHEWASFRFQIAHGTTPDQRNAFINFADYIGGQLLVATPMIAPLVIIAAIRGLRATAAERLIAVTSLTTLAFFALTSFRHKVEANWPSQAWLPLVILFCVALPSWSSRLQRLARTGIIISAVMTFILHLPPALLARVRGPHATTGGWRALATLVHEQAAGLPIYCTRYQDAALFAFYLPGRPIVPLLRTRTRWSHYDYLPLGSLPERFLLLNNEPFAIGELSAGHGHDQIRVEVLTTGRTAVDVDGFQQRHRYYAICRPLPRDATSESR